MYWDLVVGGQVTLSLRIDHEFFDWLRPHVSDYEVAQFDPFRDTVLGERLQECWLTALKQAREALRREVRASLKRQRLPADVATRELVVSQLVERELAQLPWVRFLDDLIALLELAQGTKGTIHTFCD